MKKRKRKAVTKKRKVKKAVRRKVRRTVRKAKRKMARRAKRKATNKLFPGLPHYKGPQRGWFAFVHHGKLFERATEDMRARVDYVRTEKPHDEVKIRLAHIMYLGDELSAKLDDRKPNLDPYLRINDDIVAKGWVMEYIKKHKPKNKWNEDFRTLVKADGSPMSG